MTTSDDMDNTTLSMIEQLTRLKRLGWEAFGVAVCYGGDRSTVIIIERDGGTIIGKAGVGAIPSDVLEALGIPLPQ